PWPFAPPWTLISSDIMESDRLESDKGAGAGWLGIRTVGGGGSVCAVSGMAPAAAAISAAWTAAALRSLISCCSRPEPENPVSEEIALMVPLQPGCTCP